jgi:hypothetical protein
MAPARAAAYIGGTTLLVAWLASAASVTRQTASPATARRVTEVVQIDAIAADVQLQAARLRTRLKSAPALQAPLRNPFAFSRVAVPVRPAAAPRVAAAVHQEETLSEPPLELVGVAEQKADPGPKRTAMISAPGDQLFMVTEGQELAGRYRVSAIGADAVELLDVVSGARRRLALR